MVSADLDSSNVFNLTRNIWRASRLLDNINVHISPSGKGFHIKGKNKSEYSDLEVKCFLDSDPVAIRYGIKRKALGGGFEVCFDWKDGGNSRDITHLFPIDEMKNMDFEEVKKLSKEIEDNVKEEMNETWITGFAFDGEELKENLKEVCENINEKDESFTFSIYENYQPNSDYVLLLYSDSKDNAHERGMWTLNRVFNDETDGDVTEKDLEKVVKVNEDKDWYYWIKQKEEK